MSKIVVIFIPYKEWFIYPKGTAFNQPAYPYASYSTQSGNPATNLYPVGNYPTQYSSGTIPQPQYQYQFQPSPQPAPYQEPEKVPSAPPPSYDEAHKWLINSFIARMIDKWISKSAKVFFHWHISVDLLYVAQVNSLFF